MFGINNEKIRLLQESLGIRSRSVEIVRKKKKRVSKLGISRVKRSEFVKKSDDFDFSRICTSESESGMYVNEIAPTNIEESINKYENDAKTVENTTNVHENDVKTVDNTTNVPENIQENIQQTDVIHKIETENTAVTVILSTPTPKETFHRNTLSITDFHFVRSINHNDIDYYSTTLRINITKNDPIYHVLSPYHHEKFFDHNIPEIRNKAPTIQQLFVELLVHPEELDCFGNLLPSFFKNINDNFFLSKNARERKYKSKPKYYYYIDPETHKPIRLDLQKTHTLFMKTYITHIQTNHSQLINFIREISLQSQNIIISGPSITQQDYSIYFFDNKLHDKSHLLNPEFCLAKLLIS